MKKDFLRIFFGLALFLVSFSVVAEEKNDKEGDFIRGAQVWADNCMRCHNLRDPQEFRDDLWKPVIFHMRVRAGLTGQESRDVLKYLQESN